MELTHESFDLKSLYKFQLPSSFNEVSITLNTKLDLHIISVDEQSSGKINEDSASVCRSHVILC